MGAGQQTVLIEAKQNHDETIATDVAVGTIVKAIYIEVWVLGGTADEGSFIFAIEKLNQGSAGLGFASMADLHNYANKANIFFTSEGLTADQNGNPTPIYRDWLKIPKGKQRFALGDKLAFTISAVADPTTRCGCAIFKAQF